MAKDPWRDAPGIGPHKSGIHIKKKNRGKFKAYAKGKGESVQEAAADVLADKNASPALKRRANFARNAAHWKR